MAKLIKNFRLIETYHGEKPFRVDREAGIIHGVKIIGKVSRNGREYTDEALSKAKGLYEGAKVNIDHRTPEQIRKKVPRSYADGFGDLRNVTEAADGLYGDLHYNREHTLAKKVAEDAERFPSKFGLSHDADGQARRNGNKMIVESVDVVNSVDIVGSPATTNGLFEAVKPQERRRMKITIRSLVESVEDSVRKSVMKKRLTEMAGDMAPMMDAPVDAPDVADTESGGSEDQIDAAFKAMVVGVLDDDSLDVTAKMAKIKLILTSQDKLLNGTDPKPPADAAATDGSGKDAPVAEGKDTEAGKLLEEIRNERADMRSERLLESAGIEVTEARLKILRTASEAERKELLEGWPKLKQVGSDKPRPGFTGRKHIQEGTSADADKARADARSALGLPTAKV